MKQVPALKFSINDQLQKENLFINMNLLDAPLLQDS